MDDENVSSLRESVFAVGTEDRFAEFAHCEEDYGEVGGLVLDCLG